MTDRKKHMVPPPFFRTLDMQDMNREAWVAAIQPEVRYICGRIETWRQCRNPRCRRARTCTGSHIPRAFHPSFPPCIASNDDHQRWVEEHERYLAELRAYADYLEREMEA